jgi:Aldo/keto reductase family
VGGRATSFELLDRFVSADGTMIDTANSYAFWVDPSGSGGQSEQVVGRWLARRGGIREQIHLASKVGAAPAGPGEWPANAEGLSAPAIKAAVQASLGRLQTDRIDLYWTHMEDRSVPLAETAGALAELAAAGTVGRLGCSNHPVWRLEQARQVAGANGWAEYTALQLRHSYLQPRPGAPVPGTIRFDAAWPHRPPRRSQTPPRRPTGCHPPTRSRAVASPSSRRTWPSGMTSGGQVLSRQSSSTMPDTAHNPGTIAPLPIRRQCRSPGVATHLSCCLSTSPVALQCRERRGRGAQ